MGIKLVLSSSEVRERLGISRATFYLLRQKDPTFPKPVKALSARKLVFSAQDLAKWLETAKRG